jgi:hypothetical protein
VSLILLCLIGWTSSGPSSKLSHPVWEYKVVTDWNVGEPELNRLGAEGWELTGYDSGTRGGIEKANERYIFRRLK